MNDIVKQSPPPPPPPLFLDCGSPPPFTLQEILWTKPSSSWNLFPSNSTTMSTTTNINFVMKHHVADREHKPQCVSPLMLDDASVSSGLTMNTFKSKKEDEGIRSLPTAASFEEACNIVAGGSLEAADQEDAADILCRMSRDTEIISMLLLDEEEDKALAVSNENGRKVKKTKDRATAIATTPKKTAKKRAASTPCENEIDHLPVSKKYKISNSNNGNENNNKVTTTKETTKDDGQDLIPSGTKPESSYTFDEPKHKTSSSVALKAKKKPVSSKTPTSKSKKKVATKSAHAKAPTDDSATNNKSPVVITLPTTLRLRSNVEKKDLRTVEDDIPDFLKGIDPYHIDEPLVPSCMQNGDDENSSQITLNYSQLGPNDVLMGRGNAIASYPGNKRYRQIIRHYRPAYMNTYRYEKRFISQQVVTLVSRMGGRFLEEVPGDEKGIENSKFRPISLDRALEKIAQACRDKPASNITH